MEKITTRKFDPEEHQNNVYEAFVEFVEEFTYEYDAIAKEPPKELDDAQKVAWVAQNKRKVFLGKFSSRNLQKTFEQVVASDQRGAMTYEEMVKQLKEHFEGGRNKTLANFEFHKLLQKSDESLDAFVTRVKKEASQCDFKCANDGCDVRSTLVRDQIIIGITNDEIRKNALKNQWGLADLVKNGRALEAATYGANQIKQEQDPASISRIGKPGKYSRKSQGKWDNSLRSNNKPTHFPKSDHKPCTTCSNKNCRGGKNCVSYNRECFDCGKTGHFRGAAVCTSKQPSKPSRRVRTKPLSDESSDDEQSIPESSDDESDSEDSEDQTGGKTRDSNPKNEAQNEIRSENIEEGAEIRSRSGRQRRDHESVCRYRCGHIGHVKVPCQEARSTAV